MQRATEARLVKPAAEQKLIDGLQLAEREGRQAVAETRLVVGRRERASRRARDRAARVDAP